MKLDGHFARGLTAAAVCVLAGVLGLQTHGATPVSCGGASDIPLRHSNTRCELMGVPSPRVSTETCCGTSLGFVDDQSTSQTTIKDITESVCRSVYTEGAYVLNDAEAALIDASDLLKISLVMDTAGTDDTCCRTCSCVGDPDCRAFDGTRNAWVVCDGRRRDTCQQGRTPCLKQRDHAGNRCVWLRRDEDMWESWEASGSPCQANWTESGYPTMLMFQSGAFKVELTLGERGVIRDMAVTNGETAARHVLSADACFQNDPRKNPGDFSAAAAAWTSSNGAQLPGEWRVSTPNDVEIAWHVSDVASDTFMQVMCTQEPGSSRTRLDIPMLYTTADEATTSAAGAGGFCVDGQIDRGGSKPKFSGETNDFAFQQRCLDINLPSLVATCKALVSHACNEYNTDEYIRNWCERADLQYTDAKGDPAACYAGLTAGSEQTRAATWARYACQLNRVPDVEGCRSLVSQFGWADFLQIFSDGIEDGTGNAASTCAANSTRYATLADTECALGIAVEYESAEGVWEQAFFIPADLPPCNGELVVSGAEHAELFQFPIRFRQCSLAASCLPDNACAPTLGFEVGIEFSTESCDLARPECFSQICDSDPDVSIAPQRICEAEPDSPREIGECDSCCVSDDLLPSVIEPETARCRALRTQRPYCDPLVPAERPLCEALLRPNSGAELTIAVAMNETDIICCKTCAAWGDPLISSFTGVQSKWILCDGRNDRCGMDKNVCLTQIDHAGHTCAWHPEIAKAIKKNPDIGAYGSPCQSNETLSGAAVLTMYAADGFRATITNGERSVITHLQLDVAAGSYELDASNCFLADPMAAWSASEGSDPITEGLVLSYSPAARTDERLWSVVDPATGIFVKVVCVRMTASTGFVGGYRLNVEALIDVEPERYGTGFCVSGDMTSETGQASTNPNSVCQENVLPVVDLCRVLGAPSCVTRDLADEVAAWCGVANIFEGQDNRQQQCLDYIRPTRTNEQLVLNAWLELYCDAVNSRRDPGQSPASWRRLCVSHMQNEGFAPVVREYGDGTVTSILTGSVNSPLCAADVSKYRSKAAAGPCMPGLSVQFQHGGSGQTDADWTEAFFIPQNLPPCQGELVVPASAHPQLFTFPIRFVQCDLDKSECPVDANEEVHCAPAQGFTVSYKFHENDAVCASQ